MANLLKPRKASSNPSYEGFDLSHWVNFTSSVGQILPIHWDFLIPGDKVSLRSAMKTRLLPMNSASPISLTEHIDYYFVPLECLYSLFPSLLSDTNEDASSTMFDLAQFRDGIPMGKMKEVRNLITSYGTSAGGEDSAGFDFKFRGSARLIEFFKYGKLPNIQGTEPGDDALAVNFLLAQAYQAVWQYYFRDDKRITFDSSYFNVDKFYGTLQIGATDALKFFDLKYRPWKKDPYTIVSPSPLGGQSSLNHFSNSGRDDSNFASFVQQWLTSFDDVRERPLVRNSNGTVSPDGGYTDVSFPSSTYGFDEHDNPILNGIDSNAGTNIKIQQSLQQHRIAQAIEKLSSIWMQSGKNYKDMMSNLFGVKVRDDWSKPIYIGSHSNIITINEEVANMTTGSGSPDSGTFESYTNAGDITGRGYGASDNSKPIDFKSERHGILLALYSCVPDAVYSGDAVDMFNRYSKRNSFPFPQSDELGEQPLFDWEIQSNLSTNSMLGWLPRFHELKLKENRVYGAFRKSLKYWIPSHDWEMSSNNVYRAFYINPNYLNPIMLQEYNKALPTPPEGEEIDWDKYDRFEQDPLMHFFYIEEHKGSKMSSYGVPKTYFG